MLQLSRISAISGNAGYGRRSLIQRFVSAGRNLMRRGLFVTTTIAISSTIATAAHADPCEAIVERGPKPTYLQLGRPFTGPVVYIADGDGLCVAAIRGRENDPSTWVEVRLADIFAPELHEAGGREAKAILANLVSDRRITCTPVRSRRGGIYSYDRVVATCTLAGRSLADGLRRAGLAEGGNGYR